MTTYLLTWNPERWPWERLGSDAARLQRGEDVDDRWSTGNTKSVRPGDRLFLLRQGREPRGIMASGFATSDVYQGPHWDSDRAGQANLVNLRWDALVDPENDPDNVLPVHGLRGDGLDAVNWKPQGSGTSILAEPALALDRVWCRHRDRLRGEARPDEITNPTVAFPEGAVRTVLVNSYERDPRNRRACIEHWGTRCVVCQFDFERTYGPMGAGFIEVHHLTALSEVGEAHPVDPVQDMRPVCPNCHAMLHKMEPAMSPDELQRLLVDRRH